MIQSWNSGHGIETGRERRRRALLVLSGLLLGSVLQVRGQQVVSDGEKSLLMVRGGRIETETAAVYDLKSGETAFLSPRGGCFAVLAKTGTALAAERNLRVYARDGRMIYQIPETRADIVYTADNGACLLITILGIDPNSKARLDIVDEKGKTTGSATVPFPGECKFFPGNAALALAIPGESIRVFSIGEGREVIRVPYARAFLPLVGSQILLVDRAWLALYREGKEAFRRSHDLYYPRLILADRENRNALIGCHHEVVLADIQEGRIASRWKAPASFGVISIGAAGDFSAAAVGARSLSGVEAVYILDKDLKTVRKHEQRVPKPSGVFPKVVILEKPRLKILVYGQAWEKTL